MGDPVDGSHFKSIWDDGIFNMKHIRTEVIELGSTAVVMSSWGIRNQALKSLEELATHLDASFLHYYTQILDGKYFNGKESIVKGMVVLGCQADDQFKLNTFERLLTEAQNGTPTYKKLIYQEISDFAQALSQSAKSDAKEAVNNFLTAEHVNSDEYNQMKQELEKWN